MKLKLFVIAALGLCLTCCNSTTVKKKSIVETNVNTETKEEGISSLFEDLKGNPINLSDYKGKKLLLNYWATWCVPCINEMPSLLKLQEVLEKENYVFLLASDESKTKIEKFIKLKKFDFNFIRFRGTLTQENIYALPTTFIYNEEGEKVEEIVGAVEWDSKEIIDKLKEIQ